MFSDVDGVNVATHYIDYSMMTSEKLSGSIQWVHDRVMIPGIEAAPGTPEAVDAVTSASRPILNPEDAFEDYIKTRNSLQGSVGYEGANASYYVSSENDYFAQMLTAGYNRGFLDENFKNSYFTFLPPIKTLNMTNICYNKLFVKFSKTTIINSFYIETSTSRLIGTFFI